ncbi:MAG TPA: glycosyltransferase [Gaiellaceae bacterium]|nr:glycosyltransferase [Gaiellaceae bacterium]
MTRTERAHAAIYAALFVVLAGSATLFVSRYGGDVRLWERFTFAYLLLLVVYTWYLFGLLLVHDVRPARWPAYAGGKLAVIVPCFNESPDLLEQSIRSVLAADGRKQVIVVDDGSTNGVGGRIEALAAELPISVHYFAENRGKREALHTAVTQLLDPDVEFVVTIDSDTLLEPDALTRVVEPLQHPGVGASTGNVLLLNERQNLLTRMIGTYYWVGLNIYKQAQSVIRSVVCCSGCLAAYRAPLLRDVIEEFAGQRFLGEACTHSEDRHLTNLVLRRGHDVVYVPEAVSWTETPATVRGFLRQQRRWKRGYIRESAFTLTYAWRTKRLLFLQIALWDLTAPFLSFGLRIALAVTAVEDPSLLLKVILPSWVILLLVRYVFVPVRAPDKLVGLFLYMLFYECCLYWLNLWALFTVKNTSWVTRQVSAQA